MRKAQALFVTTLMLLSSLGFLDFIVAPVQAQGSFYTKTTNSLTWFNRVSTTPIAVGDDVGQWIDLDPSWMFYCTEPVKLRVYVCSNGFLIFDPTAATNDYSNSLEELKSRWKIAAFWDDLRTDVAGGVVTNPGVYVDRDAWKVVITWEATRYGASSDSIRFQAVLWHNGSLWISIKDATNFNNFTPTIGISKGDNTNYYDLTSERATSRTWKFNIANEIDRALALGKRWLDRMYFQIPQTTRAFIKDYPGLPLQVYDASNGKWYRSGQVDKKVRVEALSAGNIDEAYYYFNTDSDDADNEPKVYVKYWSANSESMTVYVKLISCDRPDPQNLYVYIGNTVVGNCGSSFEKTISNVWGFASHQYVVRHSTRMAQRFYEAIGDTRRAERLNNFLTAYGYTNRDVYDPLFYASNSYPDNFFTQTTTFPDPELWSALPSGPYYHPYGTRLQNANARNFWVNYVETNTPRYDALYALHLLNKYGSSKLSDAKYWIDQCQWDGFGVRRWVYVAGLQFVYAAYPGYTVGPFLAAVAKYASMTGDSQYLQMADRAAGVILLLQWKYPDESIDFGTLYRADHVGGFKTGYVPGNSMVWNPIWSPVVDQFFWILDRMGFISLNPHEMPGPATTSSECTIMSLQALRLYKQLLPGRTPNKPGMAPKLNVRPADATYATGGGIWQASADKKGTLMAKASGGPASWAESAVKYKFIPDADISNPTFEYVIRDRVYLDGLGIGIAISYQYMRLWRGSTKIFEKIVQLHSASGSNYGLWDDYHVISYNYQGTLSKGTQYTLEVGYRIEANYGFGSTSPQVDVLWIIWNVS